MGILPFTTDKNTLFYAINHNFFDFFCGTRNYISINRFIFAPIAYYFAIFCYLCNDIFPPKAAISK